MSMVEAFIAAVPKVELHVHLVGSASPETVAELASRHPTAGVPADVDALASWFEFTDFAHFIDVYAKVSSLVTTGEDVATLVEGAARSMAAQQVRYAELTVTPYTQVAAGIPYPEVVAGLDAGRAAAQAMGVSLAWIFDIPGGVAPDAAEVTTELAVKQPPDGLVGFGLAGVEHDVARADFAWAFDLAQAVGLHSVPHAGEADGPHSVRAALDHLGAERIGHGVRAVEDPDLVQRLADEQVPLEVCPSSNICTRVFTRMEDHSLPELLEAGVFVTINSDDPPMFSTTLNDEYRRIAATFDYDVATLGRLVSNGVTASFLDQPAKIALLNEIAAVTAQHRVDGDSMTDEATGRPTGRSGGGAQQG